MRTFNSNTMNIATFNREFCLAASKLSWYNPQKFTREEILDKYYQEAIKHLGSGLLFPYNNLCAQDLPWTKVIDKILEHADIDSNQNALSRHLNTRFVQNSQMQQANTREPNYILSKDQNSQDPFDNIDDVIGFPPTREELKNAATIFNKLLPSFTPPHHDPNYANDAALINAHAYFIKTNGRNDMSIPTQL